MKAMYISIVRLVLALLALSFAAHTVKAQSLLQTFEYQNKTREFIFYQPESIAGTQKYPLVMVLHGRGGDAKRAQAMTQFDLRADQHQFHVVYPQGLDGQWNYLHGVGQSQLDTDDPGFLIALIKDLSNQYAIDKTKIFVTGISNGGFMVQRLACIASDHFAAFASVAAGGYAGMELDCHSDRGVNMLYLHGTADRKVPWQGLGIQDSAGNKQLVTMSITDSVKFWSQRNDCSDDVKSMEILPKGNSPGTHVKIFATDQCAHQSKVVLYAIVGGGHNWPGVANFIAPQVAGRVNLDIHASDEIWSFFRSKQLH